MEKLYEIGKFIYRCPIMNLIIKPVKGISSIFSFLCCHKEHEEIKVKEKGSDEELKTMVLKKKKLSYTNLNTTFKEYIEESKSETLLKYEENKDSIKNNKPRFNSKIMFNIDDRSLFIKNSKSKDELNKQIELFEESLYIKCKYCGKEVNKAEIYCIYDNYYCSERCRHLIVYKK